MMTAIIVVEAFVILALAYLWRRDRYDRDGWRWSAKEWERIYRIERGGPRE